MVKSGCHVRLCRTVRAQFIGDDPLWNKAIALYQRRQQALGRPLVAALLQDFFENGAILIDCAPEPELLSSAFHNDLVQIPNIARARLSPPQVVGDLGSEPGDPTADCLIGYVDTTLEQHFLNFTQAHVEPQVKPNCVSDYLRRKTVSPEADIGCLHRRNLRPTRNAGNCKPVYVTKPGAAISCEIRIILSAPVRGSAGIIGQCNERFITNAA